MSDRIQPSKITSIEDAKLYLVDQNARLQEREEARREWQMHTERRLDDQAREHGELKTRVDKIERRLIAAAGFAAGGGSLIGGLISQLFTGNGSKAAAVTDAATTAAHLILPLLGV